MKRAGGRSVGRAILVLAGIILGFTTLPSLAQSQSGEPLSFVKEDWTASWIWRVGDEVPNMWAAFRKKVTLDAAPSSAIANIAVDSKYWLWINGVMVVREGGLKRGPTPNDTYYDEVDIAPYLVAGENTIAILVWYWGRSGYSHLSSGKAGLLFEAAVDGQRVISDRSWKAYRLLAFGYSTAPVPNFRLPEHNVMFNAQDYPDGWMMPGFDDSQWPGAIVNGAATGPPWNQLYRRPVPQWRQSGLLPYRNSGSFPAVSNGDTLVAELPHHAQVTPYFRIEAAAGDTIDVRTDRYTVPSTDGVRQINTIRTIYVTKAGEQEFETPAWMNGEAVRYYFPAGVRIIDLRYRESGFDTDFVGAFDTDDPFLNTLWVKARRTIYGTMRDYFMETSGRERKQATSDGARAVLSALYSMDSRARTLMRKFWAEFSDWRAPNGAFRSGVPGNWLPEQAQINLYAYGDYGFWRYFLITDDREALEYVYPHIKKYLLLWTMGPSGLVYHRPGDWDWFDWEFYVDEPLIENALYQIALRSAIKMAVATGNESDIPEWERRMELIQAAYNQQFWRGSYYMSADHRGPPDDRGNALAYLAGLSEDRFEADLNALLRNEEHASPYMDHFVLKALLEMGDVEGAIARMKDRYGPMVAAKSTTLPEYWDASVGSKEHPFATGTLRLMTNYIAGIQPLAPGFERFAVEPNPGPLHRVRADVETNFGLVSVELDRPKVIERGGPAQALRVVVPEGTTALVGIPKPEGALDRIEVDGQTVWNEDHAGSPVAGVRPIIETDTFVRFEVAPGTRSFELYLKPVPAVLPDLQTRTSGSSVLLSWSAQEVRDSTEFIVEERINDSFEPIGLRAGAIDDGGLLEFEVRDPTPGWHVYRVMAVGVEGGVSFSPVAALELPGERGISVSAFYPNPASQTGAVTLSVTEAQEVAAELVNALGQKVRTVARSYFEPGRRYRIEVELADLPAGAYALVLTGTDRASTRFVVVH